MTNFPRKINSKNKVLLTCKKISLALYIMYLGADSSGRGVESEPSLNLSLGKTGNLPVVSTTKVQSLSTLGHVIF